RSRDRHMKEAPTGCPTGARGIQTIRPMRGRPTAPAAEPPRVFRVTPGYDVLGLDSAALDSAVASAAFVSPADSTSPCAVVVSASAESLFAWSSSLAISFLKTRRLVARPFAVSGSFLAPNN